MLGTNTSPAILVPRRNYLLEAPVLLIPRPMCFPLDATENRFDHSHGRSVRLCVIRSAPSHITIQKSSATGGATDDHSWGAHYYDKQHAHRINRKPIFLATDIPVDW